MKTPIPPLIEQCPDCGELPSVCKCYWRNTDDDGMSAPDDDAYFDCRDCYTRHKLSEPCKY